MTDLWSNAATDHDAVAHQAKLSAARVDNAEAFTFCASATNINDFEHRLALVAGRLPDDVRDEVAEGWRTDYIAMLESAKTAANFNDNDYIASGETGLDLKPGMPGVCPNCHSQSVIMTGFPLGGPMNPGGHDMPQTSECKDCGTRWQNYPTDGPYAKPKGTYEILKSGSRRPFVAATDANGNLIRSSTEEVPVSDNLNQDYGRVGGLNVEGVGYISPWCVREGDLMIGMPGRKILGFTYGGTGTMGSDAERQNFLVHLDDGKTIPYNGDSRVHVKRPSVAKGASKIAESTMGSTAYIDSEGTDARGQYVDVATNTPTILKGALPWDSKEEGMDEGWYVCRYYRPRSEVERAINSPVFGKGASKTASTYQVRTKLDEWDDKPWKDAGNTIEEAEKAVGNLGSGPSTIVLLKNNDNGSVTVYDANSLGYVSPKGLYEDFYGSPPKSGSRLPFAEAQVTGVYYDRKGNGVLCDACGAKRWGEGDDGFNKRYDDKSGDWCWDFRWGDGRKCDDCGGPVDKTASIITYAEFPPKKDDKEAPPAAPAQQPAGAQWQQQGAPSFGGGTDGLTYWGFYAEVDGIAMEIGSPTAENDGQWKWFVGPADKPGTAYAQGDASSVEEAKSAAQAAADQAKANPPGDQAQDPNAPPPAPGQPPQPGAEQPPAAHPPADPNAAPPKADGEQKPPEHKPEEKKPDPNCPPPKKAAYDEDQSTVEDDEEEGGDGASAPNQNTAPPAKDDSGGGIGDIVQSVLPLLLAVQHTAGTDDPALQADEQKGEKALADDAQSVTGDIGEIAQTVLPMLLASVKTEALIHVPDSVAFDVRGWVGPHAAKVTQRGNDVIVSLPSRWLPQAIAILSEKYPTVYLDGNTFTASERVAIRHLAATFSPPTPSAPQPTSPAMPPQPPAVTTTPKTTKPRNGQSPPATINQGGAPQAPSMTAPQPVSNPAPGAPAQPDVPQPAGVT